MDFILNKIYFGFCQDLVKTLMTKLNFKKSMCFYFTILDTIWISLCMSCVSFILMVVTLSHKTLKISLVGN